MAATSQLRARPEVTLREADTAVPAPDPESPAGAPLAPARPGLAGRAGRAVQALARARRDPFVVAGAVLVLVPSLAAAVSALRNPWIPTNDWALIELQVRQVGTADTPLVGVWSRFGWRHPGPLMFYALALPYRLVPDDRGLLFATACVNLVASGAFALVVARYQRSRALVALAGLALVQFGIGADQLGDPWNPTILIVPFALYLVLCVELAEGRAGWALPATLGVGTFVVQAHVGLLQPVVLLFAAAIGLRWYLDRHRRTGTSAAGDAAAAGGRFAPSRPGLVAAAMVLGLAWLPPLIDQANGTGNLTKMARWARGDTVGTSMGVLTEGRLSGRRVVESASWLFDPAGQWLSRSRPVNVFGTLLLGVGRPATLLWVPVALAAAVLIVRRLPVAPAHRRATTIAAVLSAAAVVSVFTDLATARGAPVYWPFRWVVTVIMLLLVTLGWAVAGVVARRFPWIDGPAERASRWGTLAAGCALVAGVAAPVVLATWHGSLGRQPVQGPSAALLRLEPALVAEAGRHPLVAANTVDKLNDKDLAVPVMLERAGIDWIERGDPDAAGLPGYMVVPASDLERPLVASGLAVGATELVARSGPPRPGEPAGSELAVLVFTTTASDATASELPD